MTPNQPTAEDLIERLRGPVFGTQTALDAATAIETWKARAERLADMHRDMCVVAGQAVARAETAEAALASRATTTAQTGWTYSINYGPDGEENWANLTTPEGQHVANIRTHHAMAIVACMNAAAIEAALSTAPSGDGDGLSEWAGWDQARFPWGETKHKDAVLEALFRGPWSVEDCAILIDFIDRTWTRRPAASSGEAVPGMVLITGCASEGCGKQATIRFERGGVGSYYCHDCYMRIQAIPAASSGETKP